MSVHNLSVTTSFGVPRCLLSFQGYEWTAAAIISVILALMPSVEVFGVFTLQKQTL